MLGLIRSVISLAVLGAIASAVGAAIAKGRLASRGEPVDDDVELVAIYSGLEFRSEAPALRRAAITAWYGGGSIDLRGASLDPAGATITVRAVFGGIRVIVPESWPVEVDVMAVLGGVGDARDAETVVRSGPTLRIEGLAIFGGVGIVAHAPDLDTVPEGIAIEAGASA